VSADAPCRPRGNLIFLGAGGFAVPALQALRDAGESVALVITQPDRPKGRGRKTEPTAVKRASAALGLPVFDPERVNDDSAVARIRSLAPEFLVVVDYGQILKGPLLGAAVHGAVNVHPSLLPRHRGPSPVAWALLCGDKATGVSTMLLDEGMDSGPVLLQERTETAPGETAGELSERLAVLGARLLVRTLSELRCGAVSPKPQEASKATWSRLIDRELQNLSWDLGAPEVAGRINALSPRPGARAWFGGRLVKCLRAVADEGAGEPGTVLEAGREGILVACAAGAVRISEVHPEGRNAMSAAEFVRGGGIAAGERFDSGPPNP
jgi:methionyl-tRNA formyltransferase